MFQVINWAFSRLVSLADNTAHASSDGQVLVALTGLLRVLWHHINVAGIPSRLRNLLLVAMALRNLLLVVALPLWARKAVAAQLRAWQQGISEAQCTQPATAVTCVRPVHLLRVMKEASGHGHACFDACVSAHAKDVSAVTNIHTYAVHMQVAGESIMRVHGRLAYTQRYPTKQ
jgi:hypothetical protein